MAKAADAPEEAHVPDRFPACLPLTLRQEAPDSTDWGNRKNFSDDPHDPGGATMNGIIQTEYDKWRKAHGLPTQPVRKITQAEGYAIYRQNYWLPHCPTLPPGLDLQFFDCAVNQGVGEATKILQVALGVESDGDFGPQTQAAVQAANVHDAIQRFTARRLGVYRETRNFQYFGEDWTRRADQIGAAALSAASEAADV